MAVFTTRSGITVPLNTSSLKKDEYMLSTGRPMRILDGRDLKIALGIGLVPSEVDRLANTDRGEKIMDEYLNLQHKAGKLVKERSSGVFDKERPNGDWEKEFEMNKETTSAFKGRDDQYIKKLIS